MIIIIGYERIISAPSNKFDVSKLQKIKFTDPLLHICGNRISTQIQLVDNQICKNTSIRNVAINTEYNYFHNL